MRFNKLFEVLAGIRAEPFQAREIIRCDNTRLLRYGSSLPDSSLAILSRCMMKMMIMPISP